MKISDFNKAIELVGVLRRIDEQIGVVSENGLGVTINGTYQKDEIVDIVRPIVLSALQKKRGEILCALTDVGVDVHE